MDTSAIPVDPYWKLRPVPPTPEGEVCHCTTLEAVILQTCFGENPLYCVVCRGEVFPERIGFDGQLAEDIASWRSISHSLHLLRLDSGEYERWAADRLADPDGQVNVVGLGLVQRLNAYVRTYYSWFQDTKAANYESFGNCPRCGCSLAERRGCDYAKCEPCSVLVWLPGGDSVCTA